MSRHTVAVEHYRTRAERRPKGAFKRGEYDLSAYNHNGERRPGHETLILRQQMVQGFANVRPAEVTR